MTLNPNIRRAQKESLLFKEISILFNQLMLDDSRLKDISVNRVKLSPDKGLCTVYFYTNKGEQYFKEILETLKLYKPSLRKSLAEKINSRRVPELVFKFDEQFEKQFKMEQLLEEIKTENKDKW